MRTTPRFARILAITATLCLAAACGPDDNDPTSGPTTTTKPNTQDGAIPVSVVNSFLEAALAGNTELACGFTDPSFQKAVTDKAAVLQLAPAKATCGAALKALIKKGYPPAKVTGYKVESAHETTTILVASHEATPDENVTLERTSKKTPWLITGMDSVTKVSPTR